MDCSLPGSSFHGILQARILEWVTISFSRGSSRLRDQTQVSCIDRQILYCLSHQGSSEQHRAGQSRLHFFLLISRDSGGSENTFVCWTLGCQWVMMEMVLALIRSLFGFLIKYSGILLSFTIPFHIPLSSCEFFAPPYYYTWLVTLIIPEACYTSGSVLSFWLARLGFEPKAGWLQHPCSNHNAAQRVTHGSITRNCLQGMRCCHREKWIKMSNRGSLKDWK